VPLRAGVVVEVVRAGDLDAARAEGPVDEVVGDDRDAPVAQRQVDQLADQVKEFLGPVLRNAVAG